MADTIALVVAGRCRPSPDRVALGASSDRHRGRLVAGDGATWGSQGFLPVLCTPFGGVGRVYRDDADPDLRAHRQHPGAEPGGGDAGNESPEPLAPAVVFAGLGVGEVEVFDRDGFDACAVGPVQEACEGVADLCVAPGGWAE